MLSALVLVPLALSATAQISVSFPIDATIVPGPPSAICTRATYNVTLPTYTIVPFSNIGPTPNQTVLTTLFQTYVTNSANFTAEYQSPTGLASASNSAGSYLISGTLCQPLFGYEHEGTVQLLAHGIPFDSNYWDFQYEPETYSYVWAASAAGYTTFRYDRLGTGLSDHPADGLNIVQADTDVQILNSLTSMLRTGTIGGTEYSKILLVAHSYGSVQATALASRYPTAVDGIIATGFSAYGSAVPLFLASGLWTSAAQQAPYRFPTLSSTYLLPGVPQAAQMNFYYYPGYDESLFAYDSAQPQPVTVGVMFTLETVAGPATNFTGPVLVVTGAQDFPFCGVTISRLCTPLWFTEVRYRETVMLSSRRTRPSFKRRAPPSSPLPSTVITHRS